jgi:putative FmdB family regulatory protein
MPLIAYACSSCGHSSSKLIRSRDLASLKDREACSLCGEETFTRQLGAPASASKITIDNGSMQKSVDINPHIIEDNIKRSKGDPDRGF